VPWKSDVPSQGFPTGRSASSVSSIGPSASVLAARLLLQSGLYCPACGFRAFDGDRFCAQCGHGLNGTRAPASWNNFTQRSRAGSSTSMRRAGSAAALGSSRGLERTASGPLDRGG
jgi:hypothetical protein